jgi:septal ring factor EnvC (AmiA/AmiB activator)
MSTETTPKRKPGRPRNQELDRLERELSVSRRHAMRLRDQAKAECPKNDFAPSPLASARLRKTETEIQVLEEKLATLRLEKRALSGELMYLSEALAINVAAHLAAKNALEGMSKTLGPRLCGQPQKTIERALSDEASRICGLIQDAIGRTQTKGKL